MDDLLWVVVAPLAMTALVLAIGGARSWPMRVVGVVVGRSAWSTLLVGATLALLFRLVERIGAGLSADSTPRVVIAAALWPLTLPAFVCLVWLRRALVAPVAPRALLPRALQAQITWTVVGVVTLALAQLQELMYELDWDGRASDYLAGHGILPDPLFGEQLFLWTTSLLFVATLTVMVVLLITTMLALFEVMRLDRLAWRLVFARYAGRA